MYGERAVCMYCMMMYQYVWRKRGICGVKSHFLHVLFDCTVYYDLVNTYVHTKRNGKVNESVSESARQGLGF